MKSCQRFTITSQGTAHCTWLKVRGREPGPLFLPILPGGRIEHRRLSDDMVYEVVKSAAEAAGLDPARFGAHSLRAGLVTASLDAGYGESVVASRSVDRGKADSEGGIELRLLKLQLGRDLLTAER